MEDRKIFSGGLSIKNRLNQFMESTNWWAKWIFGLTFLIWVVCLGNYIFLTGQAGYGMDYCRYYLATFLQYCYGFNNGNDTPVDGSFSWTVNHLMPAMAELYQQGDRDAIIEGRWINKTAHAISNANYYCLGLLAIGSLIAWYLSRREVRIQTADRFKRGSVLLSAKELSKQLRKFYGDGIIHIGGVILPAPVENLSTILIGKPQQGKSLVAFDLFRRITKRGDRSVVLCAKPGDFISQFYRPKIDEVFTPGDSRSCLWSLSNDIISISDFDALSGILCPTRDEKGAIWSDGGREIIIGLMKFWWLSTKRTNKELCDIFSKTAGEWHKMLLQTPDCGNSAGMLANPDSPTAFSFYITVLVAVKPLSVLRNMDGEFSVRMWLASGKGNIYLLSTPRLRVMLTPVFSMFLEIMGLNLLEMEQDRKRRIWWILDELPELGKTIENRLSQLLCVGAASGFSALLTSQSVSQMEAVFSPLGAKAIFNSCNTTGIFAIKDDDNADGLARTLGKKQMEQSRTNYAVSANAQKDSTTTMSEIKDEELIMSDELKMLRPKSLYVAVSGFGVCLTTVKYVPYPNLQPAFIPDSKFNLEQMEIEYAILQEKRKNALTSDGKAVEKTPQEQGMDISTHPEKNVNNELRWTMAQVLTDSDDGMNLF